MALINLKSDLSVINESFKNFNEMKSPGVLLKEKDKSLGSGNDIFGNNISILGDNSSLGGNSSLDGNKSDFISKLISKKKSNSLFNSNNVSSNSSSGMNNTDSDFKSKMLSKISNKFGIKNDPNKLNGIGSSDDKLKINSIFGFNKNISNSSSNKLNLMGSSFGLSSMKSGLTSVSNFSIGKWNGQTNKREIGYDVNKSFFDYDNNNIIDNTLQFDGSFHKKTFELRDKLNRDSQSWKISVPNLILNKYAFYTINPSNAGYNDLNYISIFDYDKNEKLDGKLNNNFNFHFTKFEFSLKDRLYLKNTNEFLGSWMFTVPPSVKVYYPSKYTPLSGYINSSENNKNEIKTRLEKSIFDFNSDSNLDYDLSEKFGFNFTYTANTPLVNQNKFLLRGKLESDGGSWKVKKEYPHNESFYNIESNYINLHSPFYAGDITNKISNFIDMDNGGNISMKRDLIDLILTNYNNMLKKSNTDSSFWSITMDIIKNIDSSKRITLNHNTLKSFWENGAIINKKEIGVGQANYVSVLSSGNNYYNRVVEPGDPLGIYNVSNKTSAWKSSFSKLQPFIYFKPPESPGANPIHINRDSLLGLTVFEKGRRSGTVIVERNRLGSRAAEALLQVRHFGTDIARRASVKPELPVRLFSGAINNLSNRASNFLSSALGGLFGGNKESEDFDDLGKNPLETDLITFAFVYFDQDLNYNKHIQFKAYLTNFNETLSPEWNSGKYVGHPNTHYTYKGITRSANISFVIHSQNSYQREINWKKINKLASLCYPQYSENNRMQGPIIKLHLGSLYKGMPGFIQSLTFEVSNNYPWDTVDRELPHAISVNLTYTIIGQVLPELDKNNHFDVYKTNRFNKSDEVPEYVDFNAWVDTSGAKELVERTIRKVRDGVSITEETIGNGLPI